MFTLTAGVIRDFAGPYYVSEDNMAFGTPSKYWQLDPNRCYFGTLTKTILNSMTSGQREGVQGGTGL